MVTSDITYGQYVQILHEELIPAMGCTEPIAIAYAAAKARSVLGTVPDCLIIKEAISSMVGMVLSRRA